MAVTDPIFVTGYGTEPFGLTDIGALAPPDFVDIDGDGDLDAFIRAADGNIYFFRNSGTATSPVFTAEGFIDAFGLPNGAKEARLAFADIDNDGDLDAFIGNQDGTTSFFRNTGTSTSPTFAAEGGLNPFGLPDVGFSADPVFVDIDGDGDLDAFVASVNHGVTFFRNTGSATNAVFTAEGGASIFGLPDTSVSEAPTFVDIDNDGDLDAFAEGQFFRNTGTPTAASFTVEGDSNPFGLPDFHNFGVPSFADVDGDGDVDAFVCYLADHLDLSLSLTTSFVQNTAITGNVAYVEINTLPSFFSYLPEGNFGTNLVTFTVSRLGDISGTTTVDYSVTGGPGIDGSDFAGGVLPTGQVSFAPGETTKCFNIAVAADMDIEADETFTVTLTNVSAGAVIVSPTADKTIQNDDSEPLFVRSADPAPFGLSDVGAYARPAFVDIDGDGDLDAFVGASNGNVNFFRNTGNTVAPVFVAEGGTTPFGLPNVGSMAAPAFADIDADGDLDAFIGNFDGNINFFRNAGNATAPVFVAEGGATPFGLPDISDVAAPTFADIDGDGDLDAFVGSLMEGTKFFRNTGDATAPLFVAEGGTAPFGLDTVFNTATLEFNSTSPSFADIDGDGDLDAFIGDDFFSTPAFFRNTGTATDPEFVLEGRAWESGLGGRGGYVAPALVDIDGDGDLDAFLGYLDGTIGFFLNTAYLTIGATDADKPEGDSGPTPFGFTVTRTGNIADVVSVDYAVTGGTADAVDFGGTLPSGQLTFAPGETSKTLTINVIGDTYGEYDDTFRVILSNPSPGAVVGEPSLGSRLDDFASGTIRNDDVAPSLSIAANDADKSEGDTGTTSFTFDVTRADNAAGAITVDYLVSSTTADAADFAGGVLPSGQVDFAAGETVKTITVDVAGDTAFEADEDFTVTLSNPSGGAVIAQATATGTIRNDDTAKFAIAAASADRAEGDGATTPFTFTVTRSGDTALAATVDCLVSSAAADAADFAGGVLPAGQVSFAAGETVKTITVDVAGDTIAEADESFDITLSNPSTGAAIQQATATGTIRNDDLLRVVGTSGEDHFQAGPLAEYFIGGEAADTVSYTNATGAGVDARLINARGFAGDALDDQFSDIENLTGSDFDDLLLGDKGANVLIGGNGDDNLVGLSGNDRLDGGAGNDRLTGGGGADALNGAGGSDTANYSNAAAGVDARLIDGRGFAGEANGDIYAGIENLSGSAFGDLLVGDNGANILLGGNGNDNLNGLSGDDMISGGNGNDLMTGRGGDDRMAGGAGNDLYVFHPGDGADTITDFAAGAGPGDRIYFKNGGAAPNMFSDLTLVSMGANTVIDLGGGDQITLLGVTPGDLAADDFIF